LTFNALVFTAVNIQVYPQGNIISKTCLSAFYNEAAVCGILPCSRILPRSHCVWHFTMHCSRILPCSHCMWHFTI